MSSAPKTALLLTGGGARAAYQVGVLQALQSIRRDSGERRRGNPFPLICGTSAGAINGMALACQADHYDLALRSMVEVWRNMRAEQIYHADSFGVIRTGAKWLTLFSLGWALARWRRARPRSLLDNDPLRDWMRREFAGGTAIEADGWVSYIGKSRLGIGPELGELQGDYLDSGVIIRFGRENAGLTLTITNLAGSEGNRFALGTPFATGREQITPLQPRTIRIGFDTRF